MTEQLIDLAKPDFWLVLVCAILLVSPLNTERYKSFAWAVLNTGFIFVILNWHGLFIVMAIITAYVLMQCVVGKFRKISICLAAVTVFILFIIHKSPVLDDIAPLAPVKNILSIVGFSYIALRMVEMLRLVFEGRHPPPSIIAMINYLIPFHMLAAGPIQGYDDFVCKPVQTRVLNFELTLQAIERIVSGLFKKFVLAYLIKEIFLTDFESSGLYFFIEVQFFFLWLYLDFSAYSDIAVGVGRLLGIATPENFNRPYLARNMIDFWERWHISLSHFLRRNIFVPIQLALNRRDDAKRPLLSASIAFSITFLLCGLWHGVTINFMLWGAIHAFGLIITNSYKSFLKRKIGAQGVKKYLANKPILYFARFLTYEFVAFSLLALFL